MDKPETPRSMEPQCVGKLEIVSAKPAGFLCGSIPVPTDQASHDFDPSALIPAARTVQAPRYRIIPTETDLNVLPVPDKVIPIIPSQSRTCEDLPSGNRTITSNLSRKGEALAVSGLADDGDEIDVIAPVDILKQIFKIPYSKAQISIAVRRVGRTLVLNVGPDFEDGEKLVRRHNKTAKCADESLFLNFAMHSVRMEACDCPPNYNPSHVVPGQFDSTREDPLEASEVREHVSNRQNKYIAKDVEGFSNRNDSWSKKAEVFPVKKNNKRNKAYNAVNKVSQVKENSRSSMQESEKCRRANTDGFLRVLFWQFHNFRMLLGSDLLILSNEKYVAVSLHLWDVSRQVTPLTWLEAWLDNVMASVPELAICYHQDGVVQGYELMKTEDIFLLKGVAEDGTPAFLPHVVQQNGHMVLRFLQENCKQDPGVYWLYKSAGEDVIELFNLSVMPKACHDDDSDDAQSVLPALIYNERSDILLSLGTLLYRVAHRLSLSMSPDRRARGVRFFRQCLDFLDEPDHLVVRALAHEQFARLLLLSDKELELTSDALSIDSEVLYGAKEDSSEVIAAKSGRTEYDVFSSSSPVVVEPVEIIEGITSLGLDDTSDGIEHAEKNSPVGGREPIPTENASGSSIHNFSVSDLAEPAGPVMCNIADSISSKLAAVHHVSQAIKSLRSKRQFQSIEPEIDPMNKVADEVPSSIDLSLCACGDADCVEVCNISQWLPTSKLDDKSWKLVLLLGESYLALGQAYKDDGQLFQAFRVVELACLVYGSMPQLENKTFISSISYNSSNQLEIFGTKDKTRSVVNDVNEQQSMNSLFWARVWTLVGDLYVEFHLTKRKDKPLVSEKISFSNRLKMSSDVVKEVERLKKKLGQSSQNCSSCSLVNCSCESERAKTGSSASSSSGSCSGGRKHSKKPSSKGSSSFTNPRKNSKNAIDVERTDSAREVVTDERKRTGGIFKYIKNPLMGDGDVNLTIAFDCYEEARKAVGQNPVYSVEYKSVARKKGWVCNELGRNRLERKQLDEAESAFADAIISCKEACDYTNIVLINFNLGHCRRLVAEEMVSKVEALKKHAIFHDAYTNALENAKTEYRESLRYYGAAKMELNAMSNSESDPVLKTLRVDVYTQYAHTYLLLGMLLAKEDSTVVEDKREGQKHEMSANEAIREALSVYESLGDSRKQEAAFTYFQLACFQRDRCLKVLESDTRKVNVTRRIKQYSALADRNWQKALEFYGPNTHPVMYLTILMQQSDLLFHISSSFHLTMQLETALTRLFEGRHVSETESFSSSNNGEVCSRFWGQIQMVLKKMLSLTLPSTAAVNVQQNPSSNKPGDIAKLKELYKMSLRSTDLTQLHAMHSFWISSLH